MDHLSKEQGIKKQSGAYRTVSSACQKSLAEFRACGRERSLIIKSDDMRVTFYTSCAASVEQSEAYSSTAKLKKGA